MVFVSSMLSATMFSVSTRPWMYEFQRGFLFDSTDRRRADGQNLYLDAWCDPFDLQGVP